MPAPQTMPRTMPRTMFDKIWRSHVVVERDDGNTLLYIDRHIVHDGSFHAFAQLRERGMKVARVDQTLGTADHYVPSAGRQLDDVPNPTARRVIEAFDTNTSDFGVQAFRMADPNQGIVHVVGPEQGFTLPGVTLVCGDSHTSTHGALGALAFGIGASEVAHVLATQTLWQTRPKTMRILVDGRLGAGVTSKDMILAIIAKIGTAGATGHVVEYAGQAVRELSIEQRLTVCNMSIEAGARAGMVAPDETTFAYLKDRPFAPKGEEFDKAVAYWRGLPSDEGARFDKEAQLDGGKIEPMVTWGTSPQMGVPISGKVPGPEQFADAEGQTATKDALDYMGLKPGTPIADIAVDQVFIGSCTNSRIEDLRAAAAIARKGKAVVPALVSAGSTRVKVQAEKEGLDRIFQEAGFVWAESSCSMCVGMNGDLVGAGKRCASTSNRNFKGRQGQGARTHLVSPAMAAAAALKGHFVDVRDLTEA